jgi:lipid II:glycine glycyltransferase (peptidoglycan interpeptide bridge formation enzyme)
VSITVSTITAAEHLAFIEGQSSVSFLQTPAWAQVKAEWRAESIGWYDGSELVGAGLVLYRQLPKVKRYLAYLPEGPAIDWSANNLDEWLAPMAAHLRKQGAFAVRMGPPVLTAKWSAAQIKEGIASDEIDSLTQLPPTESNPVGQGVVSQLQRLGWKPLEAVGGFAAGQPKYNFTIPLVDADGQARSEEDLLKGMNQLWRRNIKKAAKLGVEVTLGDRDDLPAFHDLYRLTAERDHFTPRPASYFTTMYDALRAEDPDRFRLYLAHHEGDLVAATIWIRVGTHAWYSYGASSTEKREVRGSNAIQWQMLRDAAAAGAHVYDLRGITDTLKSDDPHIGLIQFKTGTGGEAVEYVGEWDLPLNRALYKAFDVYMRRR